MRKDSRHARVLRAHPLRPIGGIGDEVFARREILGEARRVEHRAAIIGERDEPGDEGIIPHRVSACVRRAGGRPGGAAYRLEPAQLGADDEQIDAARERREIGVMQHEAAIGEVEHIARIMHGEIGRVARELRCRGGSQKIIHRRRRGAGDIWRIGHEAAPGFAGHVHVHHRIERDLEAAVLQLRDAAHDRLIGGRAAVNSVNAVGPADRNEPARGQRHVGDAPGIRSARRRLEGADRAVKEIGRRRIDLAGRGVERVPQPLHDQRDARAIGQRRLQLIEREHNVGARSAGRVIGVDRQ